MNSNEVTSLLLEGHTISILGHHEEVLPYRHGLEVRREGKDQTLPMLNASKKLQENICSRHDEVMKMFCRTDQKCICILCSMDEHKGHDTVSAAAERTERQRELEVSRQNIQQRIQDREKDVKELQQEVEAINRSADKAVEDSEKIFSQLIHLIQKRSSDVKQQLRSQQETEKKPAPAGDEDGRIIPAFSEVVMYSSMAALSGPEME
ncbi:hypothetical protein L3Q82_003868 [Scortum barcoo]|uniref:Uncharacterized protein n=1 Tax=Scortum barcoo TaxID=214431 RepID=A0ACB8X684_9TELE|nr:hypothetical protein L3Q82_003868 [Scortum barcoo]